MCFLWLNITPIALWKPVTARVGHFFLYFIALWKPFSARIGKFFLDLISHHEKVSLLISQNLHLVYHYYKILSHYKKKTQPVPGRTGLHIIVRMCLLFLYLPYAALHVWAPVRFPFNIPLRTYRKSIHKRSRLPRDRLTAAEHAWATAPPIHRCLFSF